MTIYRKTEFIAYINNLPIKESAKKNYRCFVNRIERYISKDLTPKTIHSKNAIDDLARELTTGYYRERPEAKWLISAFESCAKCVLRYYQKFLQLARSAGVDEKQEELDKTGAFDPSSPKDGKDRVLRSIALRRGQPKFRRELLAAYGYRCAVTGTSIEDALEAAHIIPYNGKSTNQVSNGLLLRSDIHALFDLGLLSVDPKTRRVYCSNQIRSEAIYGNLHGQPLRTPVKPSQLPHPNALKQHFESKQV